MSPALAPTERLRLEDMAYEIRRLTIEMVAYAQWGHMAGSVSMAELLANLYFRTARLDPANPGWVDRDRIVLSKATPRPPTTPPSPCAATSPPRSCTGTARWMRSSRATAT